MIELDGASLLFPTSFGYFDPHMLKMAKKFPKRALRALRRPVERGKHPKNAGSYFGYIDEAQYISRRRRRPHDQERQARLRRGQADPAGAAQHQRLHARRASSVNPKATTQVIFTGDWSMPVKEAEATNSLVDQGVDVFTMHVDGPKVMVETAARRGKMVCGYHASQAKLAPKAYLTGAEWNWAGAVPEIRQDERRPASRIPNFMRGGLKEELSSRCSPYGAVVSAEARKHADDIKAKMMAGELRHLQGPAQGQQGQGRDRRRHRSRPDRS